ncbi:MAG TPA: hypothetical protein VHD91_11390, partial [Gaiellaceae bacterium]|nr:hypothetical protein [Gaiellaceae bacterium]
WSYGHLNRPGRSPGYLNKPDGLDLLPAVASNRLLQARPRLSVRRVGSLPGGALAKAAAVALPGGRMMVLGGERNGASVDSILAGAPGRLRVVGRLPAPTHDAAAVLVGGAVRLFGGGQASSVPAVTRVSLSGRATAAKPLAEPLSDLGAVSLGGRAYLVGGYTGSRYASAILRYPGGAVVARLPQGTRYAGVAALGSTIYVAGGITTAGTGDAVYAVRPGGAPRRIATLPAPEAHAALAALDGSLYLIGGRRVLGVDPSSGAVWTAATLPVSLTDPSAVVLGGRILVAGGGTDAVFALSGRG